jgi:hypothetical protein
MKREHVRLLQAQLPFRERLQSVMTHGNASSILENNLGLRHGRCDLFIEDGYLLDMHFIRHCLSFLLNELLFLLFHEEVFFDLLL